MLCPGRLPPLPLGLGLAKGGGVSLDTRLLCASAPLSLLLFRELQRGRLLVRSGRPLPAPLPWLLLPVLHRMLDDVENWEKFQRTAPAFDPPMVPDLRIEEHGRIGELARGRTALVTVAVALAPLTVRGQEGESVEGGRLLSRLSSCERSRRVQSRSSGRSRSRRVRSRSRGDRSRSSDRYQSRRDRSLSSDRYRSHRHHARSPRSSGSSRSRDLPRRSRDRSLSSGRLPSSTDRSQSREEGRRARREQQEGVEVVKVSQAPAVSEAPAVATPAAGRATLAALPSAVQGLARFFFEPVGILFPGSGWRC